jgi:alpha-galactosidase
MRRIGLASALAFAAALALLQGGGVAGAQTAATPAKVLSPTPYMGWDVYLANLGGAGETAVLQQVDKLKTSGLEALGYRMIWLDSGWWQGQRGPAGQIVVSPTQWPHGIAWLAGVLHQNGFKLGVYTDAGATGCGVNGGMFGHYQQDVNTFASWGVDAIKVDWCGGAAQGLIPSQQYGQIHQAILNNSSHRPMILDICNFLQPTQGPTNPSFQVSAFYSYSFGPSDGQSWRTDTDVGSPGNVPFSSVLRNLDADATQETSAGPGHWNDPDYLAPDQGMKTAQFQTQMSMWAMLAAPLMFSDNMLTITPASLQTLSNKAVIAIDQDPAGIQGWEIPTSASGNGEAWAKPLSNGSYAIALLNRGATAQTVSTTASAVNGLPAAPSYSVLNVWTNARSTTTGALAAAVAPYSTVLMEVKPA